MLDELRRDCVRYAFMCQAAGIIMLIVFLPIEPWFAVECLGAGILFAVGLWVVSIVLDILEKFCDPTEEETP